ncbi:MAG: hypothetical protein QXF70_03395 [Candidatus Bilamarchaeaceae archaeon]
MSYFINDFDEDYLKPEYEHKLERAEEEARNYIMNQRYDYFDLIDCLPKEEQQKYFEIWEELVREAIHYLRYEFMGK